MKIPSSELFQPLKPEFKTENSAIIEVSSLDGKHKKEPSDANLEKNKSKNQKFKEGPKSKN